MTSFYFETEDQQHFSKNSKMTEITITKENLDQLLNTLEYTRATIGSGYDFPSMEGKMDYQLIHKGRAHQSNDYLIQAIELVKQLREELK